MVVIEAVSDVVVLATVTSTELLTPLTPFSTSLAAIVCPPTLTSVAASVPLPLVRL